MTHEVLAKSSGVPRPRVGLGRDGLGKVQRAALRLREEYGEEAREAVALYVDLRTAARLSTPRPDCGKLARHYMIARRNGWSRELALQAIRRIATSKRATVFFREWCATVFNADTAAEYEARKADEAAAWPSEFVMPKLGKMPEVAKE